jgi:YD repeat-containing protein
MVTNKLNALGAFEDLELFNKKGTKVYEFITILDGDWYKYTYDSNGNVLTYEDSDGYWHKYTYDSNGKELTYEDSNGVKRGFDIPKYTIEQLVEKIGHNFKIIKQ